MDGESQHFAAGERDVESNGAAAAPGGRILPKEIIGVRAKNPRTINVSLSSM